MTPRKAVRPGGLAAGPGPCVRASLPLSPHVLLRSRTQKSQWRLLRANKLSSRRAIHKSAGTAPGNFKSKCRNNQRAVVYNSTEAAQLSAAKTPAFYWKKQAQVPFLLPGGASHVWHQGKSSINANRKVTC